MWRLAFYGIGILSLASCVSSSVIPLSADVIQISTSGAEYCGRSGTREAALKTAGLETIRRGFDSFVILSADGRTDTTFAGYTPVTSTTNANATAYGFGNSVNAYGTATTTSYGGDPMYDVTHEQNLTVKMFKQGDEGSAKSLDARAILGPELDKILAKGKIDTCQ